MDTPLRDQALGMWQVEGSLRDIYLSPATLESWDGLLDLAKELGARYCFDGVETGFPAAAEIFANREGAHLLVIDLKGPRVNCHFFIPEEIELDVDPREVCGEAEHFAVLGFVRRLSDAIGIEAIITPENGQEYPYVRYVPSSQKWLVL